MWGAFVCQGQEGRVYISALVVTAVVVRRFVLGEGIEKRSTDLAKEVEEQTKAFEAAAAKKASEAEAAPAPEAAAAAPAAEQVLDCLVWCLVDVRGV